MSVLEIVNICFDKNLTLKMFLHFFWPQTVRKYFFIMLHCYIINIMFLGAVALPSLLFLNILKNLFLFLYGRSVDDDDTL